MNSTLKSRAVAIGSLVAACAIPFAGCLGYRCGSTVHPQVTTIAVGPFENRTEEPRLTGILRTNIAEHFTTDGSVRITDEAHADAVIRGHIRQYTVRQIAATKKRDRRTRDRDRDAYQSAVFRAELEVEFEVLIPGRERPLISSRTERGIADFSHLPDFTMARAEGLRRAANDVALKMVAAVTEAW